MTGPAAEASFTSHSAGISDDHTITPLGFGLIKRAVLAQAMDKLDTLVVELQTPQAFTQAKSAFPDSPSQGLILS